MSFENDLEKYAEVVVKVGLNLQPGQRLLIGASAFGLGGTPLEARSLVRLITRQAYKMGVRYVDVIWDDEELTLLRHQYAPADSFEEFPIWRTEAAIQYGQAGDAILIIYAENPTLLDGQDPEQIAIAQQTAFKHNTAVLKLIEESAMNWLVVSVPTPGWAQAVLPDVPAHQREAKLWELIFEMCRLRQPDPVQGWREHVQQLTARSERLNQRHFTALKYTAPGTDLTVGLPEGHLWRGGSLTSPKGISFVPNIPTEEVFTMPHRDRVEGVVQSSKPLGWGGILINNFTLTFEGGRVIQATAESGMDSLHNLLKIDEGASRIGEVALVPYRSPISLSGRLFYNILFDENASNHIALGNAYKFSMIDGEQMSDAAFVAAGGNQSQIHIDFMIGSSQMDVDGIRADGRREAIMRQGEWVL
jgi:aminopeptidase